MPYLEAVGSLLAGVRRVLFVPYALADHDGTLARMEEAGFTVGIEHLGLHTCADPVAAVREAEAISVCGGNTFRLTRALHELGLIEPIRERVQAGVPYVGVSAGSNVACPTMQTTNDMPIVWPPSLETLALVPFQINAHYYPGRAWLRTPAGMCEHRGETRDERIAQFHEEHPTPVIGLWEGAWLAVGDGGRAATLHGAPARLFRRGRPPVDLEPDSSVADLI